MPRLLHRREPFVYLEHASLAVQEGKAVATTADGAIAIPIEALSAVLVGPGCTLTSRWVAEATAARTTVVFVGEAGVRFYAVGKPFGSRSTIAEAQATNWATRPDAVRSALFATRWGQRPASNATAVVLGEEGQRCRHLYRALAHKYQVVWHRRTRTSFSGQDPINDALSCAGMAASAASAAAVHAVGAIPALGFIHAGSASAFVYDVADLIRNDLAEVAFCQVGMGKASSQDIRRACRDKIRSDQLIDKLIADIQEVLGC